MSASSDRRDAAIRNAEDRRAHAEQRRVAEELAQEEAAAKHGQNLLSWGSVSLPDTVACLLLSVVTKVSNDVARRGSTVLFRFPPQVGYLSVFFELHHSGKLETLESLRFTMNDNGMVAAETSIRDLKLPAPIPVNKVTSDWAEQIVEQVWEAALAAHSR
jgi:hypothetical protein